MFFKSTSNSTLYAMSGTVFTLGVAAAFVPAFNMLCNSAGFGTNVRSGHASTGSNLSNRSTPDKMKPIPGIDRNRITVRFYASHTETLPWSFEPLQHRVQLAPGETALAFYQATNNSAEPVVGISTYTVLPEQCAPYFNKIQCFCFEEQRLEPNESVDMPVYFYIDKEILLDPAAKNVTDIVLSYTFHPASKK